jgi:mRNA interferase MazF
LTVTLQIARGDTVLVVMNGDYGKPRPAVIVQADTINNIIESVIVCPMTSTLVEAPLLRIRVSPDMTNGLQKVTEIMADKVITLHRSRIRQRLGRLDSEILLQVDRALMLVLGLGQ